jgi:hypothetical protein
MKTLHFIPETRSLCRRNSRDSEMIGTNIKAFDRRRFISGHAIAHALAFVVVAWTIAGRLSAAEPSPASISPLVQVLAVRQLPSEGSHQVVVDLDAQVQYTVGRLSNPERIYVDLLQTKINPQLKSHLIMVGDSLLARVRIGSNRDSVTRVVLDLNSPLNYRVSELSNPTRLVVSLNQGNGDGKIAEPSAQGPIAGAALESLVGRIVDSAEYASDKIVGVSNPEGDQAPQPTTGSGPLVYGSGEKPGISYGDSLPPRNILLANLNFETDYNDNVLNTAGPRTGDEIFLFSSDFSLHRDTKKLSLALTYLPDFRLYRQTSSLNTTDQSLRFDSTYRASSHLSLRARGSVSYTNGFLDQQASDTFVPGLASPSSLNETLFTPTARQLNDSFRVDSTYRAGLRDSVTLFGGFSARDFAEEATAQAVLTNMQESEAGLLYSHRFSSHDTLGVSYTLQDYRFASDPGMLVQSVSFSFAKQISRSVTANVFGGPGYVSCQNGGGATPLDLSATQAAGCSNQLTWAIGGDLTKRTERNVFQITAQRQVSDGGGLTGLVTNTYLGGTLRRRLGARWDAVWSGSYAQNNAVELGLFQNNFRTENADVGLEHSLTQKVSMRVGYNFLRQRGTEGSIGQANFDRDLWYLRLSYGLGQIPLGR